MEKYYDETDQQTGEAYFDLDGEPTPNTSGCASWQLETDEDGATVKVYYDVVGNVVKTE
ncbi:MAG: hypothetical protein LUG99_18200 [Lachnospiraceae bacterium]|nr:hypothetical protein [Lachnospiraceae bacterium]